MDALLEAAELLPDAAMNHEETVIDSKEMVKKEIQMSTEAFAEESMDNATKSSPLNESNVNPSLTEVSAMEISQHKESSLDESNEGVKMDCSIGTEHSVAEIIESEYIISDLSPGIEIPSSHVQLKEDPSAYSSDEYMENKEPDMPINEDDTSAVMDLETEEAEPVSCTESAPTNNADTSAVVDLEAEEAKPVSSTESAPTNKTDSSDVIDLEAEEAKPVSSTESAPTNKTDSSDVIDLEAEEAKPVSSTDLAPTNKADTSAVIDLETEEVTPASSTESGSTKSDATKTPDPKAVKKTTKIVSLAQVAQSSGRALNIKILSKDQKSSANVNVGPSCKRVLVPKELLSKKMPLILPKTEISNTAKAAMTSLSSSKNLHKVLIPNNYVLVKTKDGLSFTTTTNTSTGTNQKLTVSKSGAQNVCNTSSSSSAGTVNVPTASSTGTNQSSVSNSGLQNVNVCNTSSSSSVGTVNTPKPIAPKTSLPVVSLPSQLQVPPLRFFTTPAAPPTTVASIGSPPILALVNPPAQNRNKPKLAPMPTYGLCQHPTCFAYRDKVMEELNTKLKTRDRQLKSTRMARERWVKRAAAVTKSIKNLERQRAILSSLESFPDELCRTLIKGQLQPKEAVKAKSLREKELREFATGLHLISPKGYDIVRGVFDKVLPDSASIETWNFTEAPVPVTEITDNTANSESDAESDADGDQEMTEVDFLGL